MTDDPPSTGTNSPQRPVQPRVLELLIAAGLLAFLAGALILLNGSRALAVQMLLPVGTAVACWWTATYVTLKPRLVLPSIVLTTGFGVSVFYATLYLPVQQHVGVPLSAAAALVAGTVAGAFWYRRFHVPFSAFLVGAFPLAAIFSDKSIAITAVPALVVGLAALGVGLWFHLRNPHRKDHDARTAFWCFLLAGLALAGAMWLPSADINHVENPSLLASALVAITVLALVIDQRALIAFPIIATAFVLYAAVEYHPGTMAGTAQLVLLWLAVITLGLWWHPIRAALLNALPDFPGKSRLPPYGPTA